MSQYVKFVFYFFILLILISISRSISMILNMCYCHLIEVKRKKNVCVCYRLKWFVHIQFVRNVNFRKKNSKNQTFIFPCLFNIFHYRDFVLWYKRANKKHEEDGIELMWMKSIFSHTVFPFSLVSFTYR